MLQIVELRRALCNSCAREKWTYYMDYFWHLGCKHHGSSLDIAFSLGLRLSAIKINFVNSKKRRKREHYLTVISQFSILSKNWGIPRKQALINILAPQIPSVEANGRSHTNRYISICDMSWVTSRVWVIEVWWSGYSLSWLGRLDTAPFARIAQTIFVQKGVIRYGDSVPSVTGLFPRFGNEDCRVYWS